MLRGTPGAPQVLRQFPSGGQGVIPVFHRYVSESEAERVMDEPSEGG